MEMSVFDKELISEEVIRENLKELQHKYVACHTNVISITIMLEAIKKDIEEWNWDEKSLEIALDEQNNQLASNVWAIRIHKQNIEFLQHNLK